MLKCNINEKCDHNLCIHKVPHEIIITEDPHHPQCVKGTFCYYKNLAIECIPYDDSGDNMANPKIKLKKAIEIVNWHWCPKEQHRQHQEVCQKCKKKCPQKENP